MNCYILAGGKSSRMGEEKGLIKIHNKFIIEYVVDELKPLFKKLIIISNNDDYSKLGLEVIPDLIKDIGPAGGIYTALRHSDTVNNFIVSCDMPFITSKAAEFIIARSDSYQITVPIHQGKFEPLFALYSSSCLDQWKEELDKGVFKLQNIMTKFNTLELNVDDNAIFNEDLFININTKEDLEKAKEKLNHGN
jgi:molybdopterin-guanine dinucleotide biosynthesis protein A